MLKVLCSVALLADIHHDVVVSAFSTTASKRFARSSLHRMQMSTNTLDGKELSGDFAPLNNNLLVKKSEIIDQTEGGVFLTGKAMIEKSEGVVISTGPGRVNQETGFQYPMPVSPGDVVTFGKFTGEDVVLNDCKHSLISDFDVMIHFIADEDGNTNSDSLEDAQVLWDTVLVKVNKIKQEKSTGGLLIASTSQSKRKKSSVGTVVKVGPGQYANNGVLMEMDVQPDDMVKYKDFSAQEVQIGDEDFAVVKIRDILAKF